MNAVWLLLMLLAIILAVTSGRPEEVLKSALRGAQNAVTLGIQLAAVYALWMGLLNIAKQSGCTDVLARWLRPIVRWLFPGIRDEETERHVTVNLSANMLGMGNAATPAGLQAIQGMADAKHPGVATHDMCMFLILNIASMQLFPTTILSLRMSAGSAQATDVLLPILLATASAACTGIFGAKLCARWWRS